jgi:hypothetical protein
LRVLCLNPGRNKKCVKKDYYLPILNIFVPQTVQMPWVAGLPFFIVTFFSSFMFLLALHLTQYASIKPVQRQG